MRALIPIDLRKPIVDDDQSSEISIEFDLEAKEGSIIDEIGSLRSLISSLLNYKRRYPKMIYDGTSSLALTFILPKSVKIVNDYQVYTELRTLQNL